jgi:hypothetical protein
MNEPVLSRLVSFADYDKELEPNDMVLLRLGRYFFQYNRAKGINVDTEMYADQVSIAYAQSESSDSRAVAGLSAGETHIVPEYRNTGYDLVMEVCEFGIANPSASATALTSKALESNDLSVIDYAWVSIYLDNGEQQSQCGRIEELTSNPTASPTKGPTASPSKPPTAPPTESPTMTPFATSQPSVAPLDVTGATAAPTSEIKVSLSFVASVSDSEKLQEEKAPVLQKGTLQKRRHIPDLKERNKLTKSVDKQPAVRRLR